ncbi:MAG: D-aminoacyl-tRNA deacylase [Eubacteriales bacterium]|jgi:D-tyrosyl-tRNA(Tyr) deacylase|nr:D-aminoacyl-tRNA deacylase [Eubacteriales bacterium]
MIALLQRVTEASVSVDDMVRGRCGKGLLILLGVKKGDGEGDARALAEKTAKLRIFSDENGKMNLSVNDVGGGALVIPQFTLYADCTGGNRPDFFAAAPPAQAEGVYRAFIGRLREMTGEDRVETGVFGAHMRVSLVNDGPVTIILDSGVLVK